MMSALVIPRRLVHASKSVASSPLWFCRPSQAQARSPNKAFGSGYSTGNVSKIHLSALSRYMKISEEVRSAVETRKPVVALETAIYTHGKRKKIYYW